jgi:hypothetical protein
MGGMTRILTITLATIAVSFGAACDPTAGPAAVVPDILEAAVTSTCEAGGCPATAGTAPTAPADPCEAGRGTCQTPPTEPPVVCEGATRVEAGINIDC